jgi:hypothetical protein
LELPGVILKVAKLVDPFSTYRFEPELELRSVPTEFGRLYYKVRELQRVTERQRSHEAALRVNERMNNGS